MVFEKEIVIDCRGHLLGRLCSIVAKELLKGQKVVMVRTEDIVSSGSIYRNKINFGMFLRKKMNTNPRRGPFHQRAPSEIVKRTVRGMIPHRTKRGSGSLKNMKAFEGIPPTYAKRKRMVVSDALALVRIKPGRKTTRLGDLSELFGWKHNALISKLEDKRKVRSHAFYLKKKAEKNLRSKALASVSEELSVITPVLAAYGHA
eukprot:30313_1